LFYSSGFGLDKIFHDPSLISRDQVETNKELITVDHLYSKPVKQLACANTPKRGKPTFKIQLSDSIPSTKLIKQPRSQMIKVDLTVKPENKSIALLKCSALKQERTVQSKLAQTGSDQMILDESKLHPMLCANTTESDILPLMDTSDVLDFDNLDAELDSILNDHCKTPDIPLLSPASLNDVGSPQSDVTDISNDSVQLNSIGTPVDTPLISDMLDPFDFRKSESLFNDTFSAELFPQLSVI